MRRHRLPLHVDARGTLIPVESSTLAFTPARVFVVTDSAGVLRGDHVVPCRQTMLLASGGVTVTVGEGEEAEVEVLTHPGDAVDLEPGEYVRYRLADPSSTIIVFADQPYRPAPEPE